MRPHPDPDDTSLRRRDDGFILVVVLLVVALLASIFIAFSAGVRTYVRDADTLTVRAKAEALADAGINLALLDMMAQRDTPDAARRFALDGVNSACQVDGATILISITDEAGKIDINAANEPLLVAALVGAGVDPSAARASAQSLLDFRDSDDTRRADGAEAADYRDAGVDWRPKNAPFDAIEEVHRVLNFPAAVLTTLGPFLTVHSGQSGIDPDAADPGLLLRLMSGAGNAALGERDAGEVRGRFRDVMAAFVSVSRRQRYTIRSTAMIDGATFVREAVADLLSTSNPKGYAIRRWRQAERAPADVAPTTPAPAC